MILFSSLVGSVLRNNVLKAVGPLAFLREVPGPPQSQRKQPLLQPHQSATNSEKQEFRSCSSPHGLVATSLPLPILSAALLPLPSSSLSFCSRMTSWCWQVLTHASWQSSQERLELTRQEPLRQPWAQSPGFAQTVPLPAFCQMAPSLQGPSPILSPSLPFWVAHQPGRTLTRSFAMLSGICYLPNLSWTT